MGKKNGLFSQAEMKRFKIRGKNGRNQLIKESFGLDDNGLAEMIGKWKNEKETKRKERKKLREEERLRQGELFPEEREKWLWRESIKSLSSSKLSTYRGCPISYYFHYIMHAKVPQSPSKIFGKEIHYMIESFHRMNFKSSDSFINFWKHRWWGVVHGEYGDQDIEFKSKDQPGRLCGLGVNILRPFYEHNKKLPKPELFEEDFGKYNLSLDGIKITGKWDRVDRINGRTVITDYKTDFHSPAENTFLLHRHPQFTFYALAWYLKHGEIPHLLFHHLRTGNVFKTRRTEDDFEYLKDVIAKTKDRVLEGDFTPFYGYHCRGCDLMHIVCRRHCTGVGSKLKKLEEGLKVEPEIDDMFSYNVPAPRLNNNEIERYVKKGDFEKAFYASMKHLREMNCPLESREGALACLLWEEEGPISFQDPEIDE